MPLPRAHNQQFPSVTNGRGRGSVLMDTEVSHPSQESSLTVLASSFSGGLPPDCTRSWLSVADGAAQIECPHASTKSEAWLAVPMLGNKLNPSMGLLLAVAGCPELPHALWGRLRLSSCSMSHGTGTMPVGPVVDGLKVKSQETLIISPGLWTGVRGTEGSM